MALRAGYFVGETFSNLRRNLLMTLAAITTVTVSLFLLGGVMLLGDMVRRAVGSWEGKVELNVFLRDQITPEQTKELDAAISAMPEVQRVFFESKADAFKEYKRMFAEQPALIDNVDADALPASYRIKLKNANSAEAVASRLQGRPGVDQVTFGGDTVKKLLKLTGLVRTFIVALIVLLLAAATMLIANTIRLAIYARRREIGIMKLVGATNWFIRVPFILEGVAEALVGATVASTVIYAVKALFLDPAQQHVPWIPLTVGIIVILKVFLTLSAVGVVIGAIGSSLALRRFLEV
jgi:cell division transport system permease protein